MANVRDSDSAALWLHNKLGTSNDSWISGSICSQLNKEVLRNIKECFPDLQTQVKLKLLLSFFHIPRRLVEEWKAELDEVIEVANADSELWVSSLAETMKTFPSTSSLNTEISDYEDTRPIFTDMVNELRKLVSKHSDLGMLPLECLYLNKNAHISVVGQQPSAVKHFTLKRKPKSANLRAELLHKAADAQSSLKKASAPTIPLRSRGMPRKMTDTTPLKGIPSRVPTSGFRSPNVSTSQQRPNLSRTPAGRKDGGIKLIEFTEQPLGYVAAKKRKRELQLEEQQKKQEQKQNAAATAAGSTSPTSSSPTQNASSAGAAAATPTTPASNNTSFEIKTEASATLNQSASTEEGPLDSKDFVPQVVGTPKTEPDTPEYAPTLTYLETVPTTIESRQEDSKTETKPLTTTAAAAKVNTMPVQTQNNNNIISQPRGQKRIKQEIEIKSEEILVPATVKLEKVDLQTSLIQPETMPHPQQTQLPQQPVSRLQQRVIIQQPATQPQLQQNTQHVLIRAAPQQQKQTLSGVTLTGGTAAPRQNINSAGSTAVRMDKLDIKPLVRSSSTASNTTTTTPTTMFTQQQLRQASNPLANLPNNISVKITSSKNKTQPQSQQQQPILINQSTPVILSSPTQPVRQNQFASASPSTTSSAQTIKSMPLSQLKSAANSGPVIISQTIIQPAKRTANTTVGNTTISHVQSQQPPSTPQHQTQYILTSPSRQQQHNTAMPTLTSFTQPRQPQQTTFYQQSPSSTSNTQTPTKILLKTSPSPGVVMAPLRQQQSSGVSLVNPPPLIATSSASQQPTMLNIQNVQLPNRPVTIQPASQAAQQQHLQAQLQQHQPQLAVVSSTTPPQQKLTQVLMQTNTSPASAVNANTSPKNKTLILTQKGVLLRNIGGDVYQQIPISNVSGLQTLGSGTTLMTTAAGPPSLVKTTSSLPQTIQLQQQVNKPQQHLIVQQQPTQTHSLIGNASQQTIIRPVMQNVQGGLATLPQGLTLIQRPGQQPQLVQVQATSTTPQSQLQRTIITQPAQQQMRSQIVLQQKPGQPRLITTPISSSHGNTSISRNTQIVQVTRQQQAQQAPPARKGLSLSNEHVHEAHEMFRKANRVSRPDKALILGFMAGMRENPRPNSENVIVIKLGDTEEKVLQEDGSTALCLVESHIRLDYNNGEWKTFQNFRRLDQNSQGQAGDSGGVLAQQNSVVI